MAFKGRKRGPVDFSSLFVSLLNAKLQDKNYPLYQTIKDLIERTQQSSAQINQTLNSFVGDITITDDTDLSAILNLIDQINNILKFGTFWTQNDETVSLPASVQTLAGLGITLDYSVPNKVTISSTSAGADADFLTWSDESATLPNSRELLAGTGVTFDDTVANQRTINSSGGGVSYIPLATGTEPLTFMSDGNGQPFLIPFVP